jgi:methyltransferase (TIGR00027 family)
MKDGRASFTASWVAGWRGLGHLFGDARIADDPYGARFGGPWAQALAVAGSRPAVRAQIVRLRPIASWVAYMQVRTRLIDDEVRGFLGGGGRQIVILGAGYDCRAARFAAELDGGRVFEVDHPATQARKRAVLERSGARPPVEYVPWHFERRALAELPAALAALGLDLARPTLTLWEGVTMYLSPEAIDATVVAARELGGAGSRLVFNYTTRAGIDRPTGFARVAALVVSRVGEPFRFGWDPPELPAWMAARGWRLDSDRGVADAAGDLLPPTLAARVLRSQSRVAVAARARTAEASAAQASAAQATTTSTE